MCNPNVDELSVMTYLSQFPNCRLKPGAPLRPKTNPARVRAYGPGIGQFCYSCDVGDKCTSYATSRTLCLARFIVSLPNRDHFAKFFHWDSGENLPRKLIKLLIRLRLKGVAALPCEILFFFQLYQPSLDSQLRLTDVAVEENWQKLIWKAEAITSWKPLPRAETKTTKSHLQSFNGKKKSWML